MLAGFNYVVKSVDSSPKLYRGAKQTIGNVLRPIIKTVQSVQHPKIIYRIKKRGNALQPTCEVLAAAL